MKPKANLKDDRRTLTVTATRADQVKIMFSFSAPVKLIFTKTPQGIAAEFTSKMFPKQKFVGIKVDLLQEPGPKPPAADPGKPLPTVAELPVFDPKKKGKP